MSLRGVYACSLHVAQKPGFGGSIDERDGKLHFKGTAASQADVDRIRDANHDQLSDPDTIVPAQVLKIAR